ncbi:MAG: LamG domain-containing protein [Verrucomicrobia bacterium]|nr:LamG domain-containing protein [Verrucomicrobiota bacterium]
MKSRFSLLVFVSLFMGLFLGGFGPFPAYGECDYERVVKSQTPLVYYRFQDPVPSGALLTNLGSVVITNTLPYPSGWSSLSKGAVTGDSGAWFAGVGTKANYDDELNPWPNFTVELWAMYGNKQVSPDGYGAVAGSYSFGEKGPRGWVLYVNQNGIWEFRIGGEDNGVCILTGGKAIENEWTHLAGTYDGSVAQFFVNGVLINTAVFYGGKPNPDSMKFGLGCRGDDFYPWTGGIDEFALYGKVLSSVQILDRTLFKTDSKAYEKAILKLNPLVYFRLNEGRPHNLAKNSANEDGVVFPGVYEGGATPSSSGPRYIGHEPSDQALCLTNNTDYLDIFLSGSESQSMSWSFTGWFKPIKSSSVRQTLFSHTSLDESGEFSLFITESCRVFFLSPGGQEIDLGLNMSDNLWNYLALVITPTHLTLWANGGRESTLSSVSCQYTDLPLQCCDHFRIGEPAGENVGTTDSNFYGEVDEWTVFNRALTEGEIKNQFYTAWGNLPPEIYGILRGGDYETDEVAKVGDSIILRADAAGSQPMAFKWFCNGELLPDSDSSILEYSPFIPNSVVRFQVLVSNAKGKVSSDFFEVHVLPPDSSEEPELSYIWKDGYLELNWTGGVLHRFSRFGDAPAPVVSAKSPLKVIVSRVDQQFYVVLKNDDKK